MEKNYRVRINCNGYEVEVESTERGYVDEKIEEYLEEAKKFSSSPSQEGEKGFSNGQKLLLPSNGIKNISLPEFLRKVKPKSGPEYAITIGYFVEKIQNKDAFFMSEIKDGFTKVKFPHSNPSDTVSKAKSSGKIMEGPEKNSYILTQTGEAWVEERLSSNES